MKTRLISACVLIGIVAVCIPFFYTRVLLFLAVGVICSYEYYNNLSKQLDIHITLWVVVAYLVTCYILAVTRCGFMTYIAWFTAAIFAALFSGMIHKNVGCVGALYTLAVLAYPCFPSALLMYTSTSNRWIETLALGAVSSILCDTFAYIGGSMFGKHKLAPDISPNKSIEGSVIGSVFSILGGLLIYFLSKKLSATPLPLVPCIVTSFVAATLGQIGDLVESMLKRYLGIKDFSNLIPGHGGLFDRADALIFAIPGAYFVLYLFGL